MKGLGITGMEAKRPSGRYEPTPRENRSLSAQEHRRQKRHPAPRMAVKGEDDAYQISPDHADEETGFRLIMESLGTSSPDFATILLAQLASLSEHGGKVDEQQLNSMLALARGIQPGDEVETMLATQMAAVHTATMTFARRLSRAETIMQRDSAERAFNKLARTFAAQMEALKRYRSKGEQRVIVERVDVREGGQAVVGNVSHGEGA